MRLLVTGATGLIGRKLLPELVNAGFQVVAASRSGMPVEGAPEAVSWRAADLMDPQQRAELVHGAEAGQLIHLAWFAAPGRYLQAAENELWRAASQDLITRFAAGGGRRVVLAGSCAQYDWENPALARGDCREEMVPPGGTSRFARAKQELEDWLLADASVEAACGRIFFVYGEGEHRERLVPSLVTNLLAGTPAETGPGTLVRDFLSSDDVARALVALLGSPVTGAVNIASGTGTSIGELAAAVAAQLGRPELLRIGARTPRPAEPPRLVADVGRLRDEVGFTPQDTLESGLARAIDWWRRQPAAAMAAAE